jgi:hypothetical protein
MADDGIVPRAVVIEVLRRNGAEVLEQPDKADMFLVVKGRAFEVIAIPEECGRKLLHYLSRKFTTPIHHFYNPLMAPPLPGEPIQ